MKSMVQYEEFWRGLSSKSGGSHFTITGYVTKAPRYLSYARYFVYSVVTVSHYWEGEARARAARATVRMWLDEKAGHPIPARADRVL